MTKQEKIKELVHHYFWDLDVQCARTSLLTLAEVFDTPLDPQTVKAAIGMAGAGRFRGQCGLVEGTLMFIGVYFSQKGMADGDIYNICYRYANEFTRRFGSLRCYDLRANGFNPMDPPNLCEYLAVDTITFAYEFLQNFMD